MKEEIKSFFWPRPSTLLLTVIFLVWQYFYAFRGIDFERLSYLRTFFGFGLSIVNWNNFFIRTFSLGAIWIVVAIIIFVMLWLFESYSVFMHNRKIEKKYINQPRENYAHLLRVKNTNFKKHFLTQLFISAAIILFFAGLFLVPNIFEMLRSKTLFNLILKVQESGGSMNFFDIRITAFSFLALAPFWYSYACFDYWCFSHYKLKKEDEIISENHFAIEVVEGSEDSDELSANDKESNRRFEHNPVI